jgi:L-threonylcarbamoyladenylate synthase
MQTDTVYGIQGVAPDTVQRLRALKGRDAYKPFLILLADASWLPMVTTRPPPLDLISLWPGPLTIVLPARGGGSVAVRIPQSAWLRAILRDLRRPLLSTSANPAGAPPAASGRDIRQWFGRRLDLIVDAGVIPLARASTLVDATHRPPRVLRQGAARLP